ncbi:MAG: hypothetical protein B6D39_11760 [Anaerolineae bacterium UTCFX2]|jgi:hypothetical protein|nr:hypothetical protein [Anaerolineales bacterium]OQY88092.1 MAG: hypothetical protein B6D39_11760 [Anaerolineae bacterium UTCFX2]
MMNDTSDLNRQSTKAKTVEKAQPTGHPPDGEGVSIQRVLLKTALLFLIVNLLFALFYPMDTLGKASLYNRLFPGRTRLPYGDNPDKAYNLSLFNLEAMFASHEIASGKKPADEFRVILIGDSSTWGYLLHSNDTLSSQLNNLQARHPDGRRIRFYNLGYPVMSLAKDLLILSRALRYEPDLIVWLVTLESFPSDKQLFSPLLQNNPEAMAELIEQYKLNLRMDNLEDHREVWERSLFKARRPLADLLRLQFYGPLWAATGIDQEIPATYTPRQEDLEPDEGFHDLKPPHLAAGDLALDVLAAGVSMSAPTPVVIINEPIFISQGVNSDIRYNFYYPRWAYDDYRRILAAHANQNQWRYYDFWDRISNAEFTNTAVHLSPQGSRDLAGLVLSAVLGTVQTTRKP